QREADPGGELGLGVDECDVRDVDGGLVRLNAAGRRAALGLPDAHVLLDVVEALDDHAVTEDRDHATLLAAVTAALGLRAADDLDEVSLANSCHGLQHLRCERDDLHELLVAKLTADRPED